MSPDHWVQGNLPWSTKRISTAHSLAPGVMRRAVVTTRSWRGADDTALCRRGRKAGFVTINLNPKRLLEGIQKKPSYEN